MKSKKVITSDSSYRVITLHAAWVADDAELFLYGLNHDAGSTLMFIAQEPLQEALTRLWHKAPFWHKKLLRSTTRGALLPERARLHKQKVDGFALPIEEGFSWLVRCAPQDGIDCSIRFADDLRYLTAVAKFTAELILHHRYFPSLAGWTLDTITRGYAERYQALLTAIPPALRAWGDDDPKRILAHFSSTIINAAVQQASKEWKPSRRNRLEKTFSQWMLPLLDAQVPRGDSPAVAKEVIRWFEQMKDKDTDTRVCFRMGEPAGERQPWTLTFLLQSTLDPSLLIPAPTVWGKRSRVLTHLNAVFNDPQEILLAGLGKASRIEPRIEAALHERAPSACNLSTPEAYRFLTETSLLLSESGFGVLLPSFWTKGQREKLGVKAAVRVKERSVESGLFGADAVLQFDWRASLGGQELTKEEFFRLAAMKTGLVRIRGQWVEVRAEHLERIRKLVSQGGRAGTVGEFLRMRAEGVVENVPVGAIETDAAGEALLERLDQKHEIVPVAIPSSFHGQLRPYQEKGVSWLAFILRCGFGACLADDMGLGKTIQLLALLLHYKETTELTAPTLLICPASVLQNWHREAQKFTPTLRALIHHGTDRISGQTFQNKVAQHDVVLTTYALARRDQALLTSLRWSGVVLDEAQNVKNPHAAQAKAVRNLPRAFAVALTGTPVENNLTDLWSISEFLNPKLLGSLDNFHTSFTIPIQRYGDEQKKKALKRIMQPFLLRRLKTDKTIISDLPEKLEMQVLCTLTREQATLYEAVTKEALRAIEEAEGIERRGIILATIIKLKQVCNHPAHFLKDESALEGRSGKLERLKEMLEECTDAGDSALVFTQFTEMGTLIEQYLQAQLRADVFFLHGGIPVKKRQELVNSFQSNNAPSIFVLSLKAGGVGLNLTAASHVFHFDRWWNPAVENQATDRAFRIGQTKRVQVHKFTCAGTLEERIHELIESKKALAESIIGAGESWLTELSTAELEDIFTLRKEYAL